MDRIATLTVNPAIDLNTSVDRVVSERKLRCAQPTREAGGGGINVSRAIGRLGGTSEAYYLAGGAGGQLLGRLLDDEGVAHQPMPIAGWTRENVIVDDASTGEQYRFGMPGPLVEASEWQQCLDTLAALTPPPAYLVASGSLAPGMPDDFYARLAVAAKQRDVRMVVDTSGTALRLAFEEGGYLFKPNLRELQDLTGEPLDSEDTLKQAARRFVDEGRCAVLVLSLGAGGALLVTRERIEHIRTPTVPIRSKVGAGDSMVAGMTLAMARGLPIPQAVRYGVAAGAAAVMTPGTELCRREDVDRLFASIRLDSEMSAASHDEPPDHPRSRRMPQPAGVHTMHGHRDDKGDALMPHDLTPDHDAPDRPDEQARRDRSPHEAIEEMDAILENETTPTEDMPPLQEDYGGVPEPPDR
jgi:6-phosphofructokinase 2